VRKYCSHNGVSELVSRVVIFLSVMAEVFNIQQRQRERERERERYVYIYIYICYAIIGLLLENSCLNGHGSFRIRTEK